MFLDYVVIVTSSQYALMLNKMKHSQKKMQ